MASPGELTDEFVKQARVAFGSLDVEVDIVNSLDPPPGYTELRVFVNRHKKYAYRLPWYTIASYSQEEVKMVVDKTIHCIKAEING